MPRLFLVGEDMIIGIGTDIVEIDRVAKAIKGEAFVKRVFTPAEAEYCRSRKILMGILTVPAEHAQSACDLQPRKPL